MANGQQSSGPQRNGPRFRLPPPEQEAETETDDDDPDDRLQVSNSVAERRLAALIGAKGCRTTSPPQAQGQLATAQRGESSKHTLNPPVQRTATMPVIHPYLPDPAPMQTPTTIRKNIISQELDEDLRRNLLWERSHNQIQGRPPRAPGSILTGPWRAMTTIRPNGESETQRPANQEPNNRIFATQRTKSWAGDYHAHGW